MHDQRFDNLFATLRLDAQQVDASGQGAKKGHFQAVFTSFYPPAATGEGLALQVAELVAQELGLL
jgi:hypothetical protein